MDNQQPLPHLGRKADHQVTIIGAGPAGLTAAYELARRGIRVVVLEASQRVGGLARSFDLWGQRVDLGPHRFFSKDRRVNALWLEMAGGDYEMVDRHTRICYRGTYFDYPLHLTSTLRRLGLREATACILSYSRQQIPLLREKSEDSFESWVVDRFGRRLYEHFFKAYSEKLWGIPCSSIDSDFAAQRIKGLSLYEAVVGSIVRRDRAARTLVDRFAYPRDGAGAVYERMAQAVRDCGGEIRLGQAVRRVATSGNSVSGVEMLDGSIMKCSSVISTMPLTLMVSGLGGVPAEVSRSAARLRFRNTIVVYLRVEATNLFPDNWIYVHSPELKTGRITNFSNWGQEKSTSVGPTILALEYWCYDDDEVWRSTDEQLIATAARELGTTGLSRGEPITDGHVERIRRCYPVYERSYRALLAPIEEHLRSIVGLHAIGRYGAFKYNNQDHSILMGILAAENIAEGATHDLWQVNTDYGTYQEATTITETGLISGVRGSRSPAHGPVG